MADKFDHHFYKIEGKTEALERWTTWLLKSVMESALFPVLVSSCLETLQGSDLEVALGHLIQPPCFLGGETDTDRA